MGPHFDRGGFVLWVGGESLGAVLCRGLVLGIGRQRGGAAAVRSAVAGVSGRLACSVLGSRRGSWVNCAVSACWCWRFGRCVRWVGCGGGCGVSDGCGALGSLLGILGRSRDGMSLHRCCVGGRILRLTRRYVRNLLRLHSRAWRLRWEYGGAPAEGLEGCGGLRCSLIPRGARG